MANRRDLIRAALGAGAAAALPSIRAHAQSLTRPVRVVVGFAPGGSADTVARLLAAEMKTYAPTFVVDNRPGAGGRIALEYLKTSATDGTAMIVTPASMIVLYPHVYRKLPYGSLTDFAPVANVCSSPFSLTVGSRVPAAVKSVADFIAWCRANPNLATYGSSGTGSMPHFAGVMLAKAAGFDFVHAPYRGAAPAMQDLLGGQIAANMAVLSTALPYIQSGELRSLALTGASRSPFLPDTPTLVELGFKDLVVEEWFGVFEPAGVSPPMVDRLNFAVNGAMKTKTVEDAFAKLSFTPGGGSPADFAQTVRADLQRWGRIVAASGFTPEE